MMERIQAQEEIRECRWSLPYSHPPWCTRKLAFEVWITPAYITAPYGLTIVAYVQNGTNVTVLDGQLTSYASMAPQFPADITAHL